MNKIPNRKAICDVLLKEAETDKDIVVGGSGERYIMCSAGSGICTFRTLRGRKD